MYTYLIVDDEALIRKGILKKLESLEEMVICVGEASNGEEALALIKEKNPDIIITDMQMPVLNGSQLLPIISAEFLGKQIIVISGFKDYDYMKHAISANAVDYILKPFSKEEIKQTILSAIKRIENNAALQNQLFSSEEATEKARYEYDIQILKNLVLGYHTMTPSITSKQLYFINGAQDIVLMMIYSKESIQAIHCQNFLDENGFGNLAVFVPHLNSEHLGFIILFVPEKSTLAIKQLCMQISKELTQLCESSGFEIFLGISKSQNDLLHLYRAYEESVQALNQQPIINLKDRSFFFEEHREPRILQWNDSEEFIFRLEAGMTDEVERLVENLFAHYLTITGCTLSDVKYHCYQLALQTETIISYYVGQKIQSEPKSSMQNIVNSMFSILELKYYYMQFFRNISILLKSQSVYAISDNIEKIKIYTQRNYQKNLTLEFISSLFYMNRSYCSHCFKQTTGENYVDYLNGIRLEKAKSLLGTTDKKMYQIAKAVGYDNVKYFFRVFKKKVGVTPEKFRLKSYQE